MAIMKFKAFLLLLALSGVIPESTSEEYVTYSDVGMEYKFHRNPLKWYDAKLKCASENAELAMPRNQAEATIIKNIFHEYPTSMLPGVTRPDWILMGFHDAFRESEFLTLNGDSIQNYYHTWSDGEPDNHNNEDCGSMHRNGKLNDFPCWAEGLFICQKNNMENHLVINEHCPTNDPAYQHAPKIEKCYKLHMNQRTWPDARVICNLEGGHLAIIRNKAEEKFLEKLFNDPANKVHYAPHRDYALIGFHDAYKESHYTTVLDERLHDIGYVNWAPGQPDNNDGQSTENCGSMYKTGALNDISCDKAAVFICELPNNFDDRFSKTN